MITRKSGYNGPQFRATRGTTQVGITLPTLFNAVVDIVVQHCLLMTLEDGSFIQDGLVHAVVRILGVLYADDGLLGLWDLE